MYRNVIAAVFSAAILWVACAWGINQLSIARLHDHRVEVEASVVAEGVQPIVILKAEGALTE
jgi:hypothetical protein